ncbi:MAG: hypothetical protein R2837_00025, partial [Aliarcobacter sp.]
QYNVINKKGNVTYENSGWLLNDFCNHLSEKNSRVFIELAKQGKFIITIEENKKYVEKASFDYLLNTSIDKNYSFIENKGFFTQINYPRIIYFIYKIFKNLGENFEETFIVKEKIIALTNEKNQNLSKIELEILQEILHLGILNTYNKIIFEYLYNFKENYKEDTNNNQLDIKFQYYVTNYRLIDLINKLFDFSKGQNIKLMDLCSGRGTYFESLLKSNKNNLFDLDLHGYETNPINILINQIMAYFHECSIKVSKGDVLHTKFKNNFNYVLCDPPMGYEINPENFSINNSQRNKLLKVKTLSLSYYFIEKVLECLSESGMGIVLVAGNSLSNKKGLQYRTELIKSKNIDAIIKVPKINSTSKKDLHIMILKRNVQAIKFLTIDDKKYLQDDDFKKINSKIAAKYFNNETSRIDINRIIANNSNLDPKEYI